MASLTRVVMVCFLCALILAFLVGGLISLVHQNVGIFLGIFVGGMVFSDLLESICESTPDDE